MQRFLLLFLTNLMLFTGSAAAVADPAPIRPNIGIEWDNSRPEQRQALDHFYRSLQQHQLDPSINQPSFRQERFEQLPEMAPMQRHPQMLDFSRQYQPAAPALAPQQ